MSLFSAWCIHLEFPFSSLDRLACGLCMVLRVCVCASACVQLATLTSRVKTQDSENFVSLHGCSHAAEPYKSCRVLIYLLQYGG